MGAAGFSGSSVKISRRISLPHYAVLYKNVGHQIRWPTLPSAAVSVLILILVLVLIVVLVAVLVLVVILILVVVLVLILILVVHILFLPKRSHGQAAYLG